MSLGTKLTQSAQKEVALQRPLPIQATATEKLPDGSQLHARATIADNDRFSKMTGEISVSIERAPAKGPRRQLTAEARAQRFAEKASYLPERLQVVETDLGGTTTVRSTPETMSGRRSPYFEAKVRDDEITLRRYAPQKNGVGREPVAFPLTDDLLNRIVEDAADALAPKRS